MSDDHPPTVALVHASTASMAPAVDAFAECFPQAGLWHLLDDRLVVDADAAGGLTPRLRARMRTLIGYAVANGADAVQLACSMYGPVAQDAEHAVPVLASDQALFDAVAQAEPRRVLVVGSLTSAAQDSAARLRAFLRDRGSTPEVATLVVEGAAAAAGRDDQESLTRLLRDALRAAVVDADLVVLAQYSLAPARGAVADAVSAGRTTEVAVLSPPHSAAAALAVTLRPRAQDGWPAGASR